MTTPASSEDRPSERADGAVGTAGSAGSAGSGGAGSHFGPLEIANALESYYPRLKGLVRAQMSRLAGGGVDQFTESATVHTDDLCMELLNQRQPFRDAEHMMAVASIRCTQLVVDYLRRRSRRKRGGGRRGGALPTELVDDRAGPAQWLLRDGVAEALTRYTEEFPRQAQTLMLRAFFGQATAQIAEILGTSTATVERDLRLARAYFRSLMADDLEEPDERASDAT